MSRVVVITGGLGAGKSTALNYLRELGARTISADETSRAAVELPEVREALMAAFGNDLYGNGTEGALDRRLLASRAFVSRKTQDTLNVIVHPKVERLLTDEIAAFRKGTALQTGSAQKDPSARDDSLMSDQTLIIEVPLIEDVPKLLGMVDEVVMITAPAALREERAVHRGMSREDARARISLQCDDETRESCAHIVIENTGGEEEFKKKLREWWSGTHDA